MNDHQAEVIEVRAVGDGSLAVCVRCCGDPSTDSFVTVHDLHRTDEEIDKDVQAHIERVAKLHAARDHAQRHIQRLIQK